LKEITRPEERQNNYDTLKNQSPTFDCVTCLKLTPDRKYLVGYWEKKPLELVKIWDLSGLRSIHEELLDLDDAPDLTEDPRKLMVLSSDGTMLYLRSDNRKGVKIISLQDGAQVGEIKNLHTNPILQILVTKDQKTIITCGRDKKVKAYDWINDKTIATLSSHTAVV